MGIGYIGEAYDGLYKQEQLSKLRIIIQELDLDGKRLLDLGCGTGFSLDNYPCEAWGVEPQRDLILHNKDRIKMGSDERIPFPDGHFDVTVAISAAHHFTTFDEILRVTSDKVVFSLVKPLLSFKGLRERIMAEFNVYKEIDEGKDLILFCQL